MLLVDRTSDALGVPSVVVDDYTGALRATKHLVKQGCRRIAHIGGQQHVGIFNLRLKGYIDALNVHNMAVDEDLIVYGKVSIESGCTCMQQLLMREPVPEAVFAVEDFTALGAMQAVKDAGLSIPNDVSVIGFANEAFGEYLTPSLSTVNQQTNRMGEAAAELFFEMTPEQANEDFKPRKLVLEPELIVRQSTNRLKNH